MLECHSNCLIFVFFKEVRAKNPRRCVLTPGSQFITVERTLMALLWIFWVLSSNHSVWSLTLTRGDVLLMAAMFHGQHVHLISLPVITFYGVPQKWTFEGLQQGIKEETVAIPEQMACQVMECLCGRLEQCSRNVGRHLSDILFKK
jgi:hypothetical protein